MEAGANGFDPFPIYLQLINEEENLVHTDSQQHQIHRVTKYCVLCCWKMYGIENIALAYLFITCYKPTNELQCVWPL